MSIFLYNLVKKVNEETELHKSRRCAQGHKANCWTDDAKDYLFKKKKSNFNKQGEDLLSKISSIFSVFMNFSESICF